MFSWKKVLGTLAGGIIALLISFTVIAPVQALTIYVATTGQTGLSRAQSSNPATPLSKIGDAVNVALPNDIIEVAPGTYTDAFKINAKDHLTIHGKANAAKPIIRPTTATSSNYSIVRIVAANNITFSGFEVDGTNAGVDCNAILILPSNNADGTKTVSHHIYVSYNKVHDVGGGGIITNPDANTKTVGCDYIYITGNEIFRTNSTGQYRSSAISFLQNQPLDTAGGYHSIIQTNRVYDNVNVHREPDGSIDPFRHSDGNGIIIDTTGRSGPRTLIQNNLVYRNGGRGIHVFLSSNVDVLNNTVYGNDLDPYLQSNPGELSVCSASNVLFSNNVLQGNGKGPAFRAYKILGAGDYANNNIHFRNNTYTATFAIDSTEPSKTETTNALDWSTTIYSDPTWGNLFVDAANGNFLLQILSTRSGLNSHDSQTALNRGSNFPGDFSSNDFNGVARTPNPPGGYVDRGAYDQ